MNTSPRPLLAAILLDALDDLQRAVAGVTPEDAQHRLLDSSSIGWTILHLAQHIDSWLIGHIGGQQRNAHLADGEFSRGGSGQTIEWSKTYPEYFKTIEGARQILERVTNAQLEEKSPYQGSIDALTGTPITGNYRLARLIVHVYYHIGEITTARATMGHQVEDFPGLLPKTVESIS